MNQRIAKYQSVPAIAPAIVQMATPAIEIGPCIQTMPAVHITAKATEANTRRRCGDIDLSIRWRHGDAGRREARQTCVQSSREGSAPL